MIALAYREILNTKIGNLSMLLMLVLNAYFDNGSITKGIYIVIWARSAIYTKEEEAYIRTMDYSKKDIFQYTILMFTISLILYSLIALIINLLFSQNNRILLTNLHYVILFSAIQTIYRASINHQASNIKRNIFSYVAVIAVVIIASVSYVFISVQLDYPMEQFVYLSLYILIVLSLIIVYFHLSYGGVDHAKN